MEGVEALSLARYDKDYLDRFGKAARAAAVKDGEQKEGIATVAASNLSAFNCFAQMRLKALQNRAAEEEEKEVEEPEAPEEETEEAAAPLADVQSSLFGTVERGGDPAEMSIACSALLGFALAGGKTKQLLRLASAFLRSQGNGNVGVPRALFDMIEKSLPSSEFVVEPTPDEANSSFVHPLPEDAAPKEGAHSAAVTTDGTHLYVHSALVGLVKLACGDNGDAGAVVATSPEFHAGAHMGASWLGFNPADEKLYFRTEHMDAGMVIVVDPNTLAEERKLVCKDGRPSNESYLTSWGSTLYQIRIEGNICSLRRTNLNESLATVSETSFSLLLADECMVARSGDAAWDKSGASPGNLPPIMDANGKPEVIVSVVSPNKDVAFFVTASHRLYYKGKCDALCGKERSVAGTLLAKTADHKIVKFAASASHALFITGDGKVWAFGRNESGQLGTARDDSQSIPAQIGQGRLAYSTATEVAVSAAGRRSAVVTLDGSLYVFGRETIPGELGVGVSETGEARTARAPQRVALPGHHVVQVALGMSHTLVLTQAGVVLAWGANTLGQCGLGDRETIVAPEVVNLDGHVAAAIAAGETHSLVLTTTGQVFSFGDGSAGALGQGDTESRKKPTLVDRVELPPHANAEFRQVAAGARHSLALTKSGHVLFWGVESGSNVKVTCKTVTVQSAGMEDGAHFKLSIDGADPIVENIGSGINIVHLGADLSVIAAKNFDLMNDYSQNAKMVEFLNNLPAGAIIVAGVKDDASNNIDENSRVAWEKLGSKKIRRLAYHESWVIVTTKGADAPLAEGHNPQYQGAVSVNYVFRDVLIAGAGAPGAAGAAPAPMTLGQMLLAYQKRFKPDGVLTKSAKWGRIGVEWLANCEKAVDSAPEAAKLLRNFEECLPWSAVKEAAWRAQRESWRATLANAGIKPAQFKEALKQLESSTLDAVLVPGEAAAAPAVAAAAPPPPPPLRRRGSLLASPVAGADGMFGVMEEVDGVPVAPVVLKPESVVAPPADGNDGVVIAALASEIVNVALGKPCRHSLSKEMAGEGDAPGAPASRAVNGSDVNDSSVVINMPDERTPAVFEVDLEGDHAITSVVIALPPQEEAFLSLAKCLTVRIFKTRPDSLSEHDDAVWSSPELTFDIADKKESPDTLEQAKCELRVDVSALNGGHPVIGGCVRITKPFTPPRDDEYSDSSDEFEGNEASGFIITQLFVYGSKGDASGEPVGKLTLTPTLVAEFSNVQSINASGNVSFALKTPQPLPRLTAAATNGRTMTLFFATETELRVRTFDIATGTAMGEIVVPGGAQDSFAYDIKGRLWRVTRTPNSLLVASFRKSAPAVRAKNTPISAKELLLHPSCRLPASAGGQLPAHNVGVMILAAIDSLLERGEEEEEAPTSKATGEPNRVLRYGQISSSTWSVSGSIDGVGFTVDQDVMIAGFGCYGMSGRYTCRLGLGTGLARESRDLYERDVTYENSVKGEITDLLFDEPVLAEAGTTYVATVLMRGGETTYGENGKRTVESEGVNFTFLQTTAPGSDNSTTPERGQIPAILWYPIKGKKGAKKPAAKPAAEKKDAAKGKEGGVPTAFVLDSEGVRSVLDMLGLFWERLERKALRGKGAAGDDEMFRMCYVVCACFRLLRSSLAAKPQHIGEVAKVLHKFFLSPLTATSADDSPLATAVVAELSETFAQIFSLTYASWDDRAQCVSRLIMLSKATGGRSDSLPGVMQMLGAVWKSNLASNTGGAKAIQPTAAALAGAALDRTFQSEFYDRIDAEIAARLGKPVGSHPSSVGTLLDLVSSSHRNTFKATTPAVAGEDAAIDGILLERKTEVFGGKTKGVEYKCSRFTGEGAQWTYAGKSGQVGNLTDSIGFRVTRSALLSGLDVFVGPKGDTEVFVTVSCDGMGLVKRFFRLKQSKGKTARVTFDTIQLKKDTLYTISLSKYKGGNSASGKGGLSMVVLDGPLAVTFEDVADDGNGNGTCVDCGQIPTLYFKRWTAEEEYDSKWLADVDPKRASVGEGDLGRNGVMGYSDKKAMVKAELCKHAISTHPADKGNAFVEYDLTDQKWTRFTCKVGVIDDADNKVKCDLKFVVKGDGKELFSSKPVRKVKDLQDVDVTITGVRLLKLQVDCPGSNDNAYALWVDPLLEFLPAGVVAAKSGGNLDRATRFGSIAGGTWSVGGWSIDAISFSSSHDVEIMGAAMYGGGPGNIGAEYTVKLSLGVGKARGASDLAEVNRTYKTDGKDNTTDVFFDNPIRIEAGTTYVMSALIKGGSATYGSSGKEVVETDSGVTIRYFGTDSGGSDNGTSTGSGQIPAILFRTPGASGVSAAGEATGFAGSSMTSVLDYVTSITKTATEILTAALESGREGDFVQHALMQSSFLSVLLPSVIAEVAVAVTNAATAQAVLDVVKPLLTQISGIIRALGLETAVGSAPVAQCVVESPHPYNEKQAVRMPYIVDFPEKVTHMVVEFAPECATSQEEDYVQVSVPTEGGNTTPVTPRYLGCALGKKVERVLEGTWPRGPVLVAGHTLFVDFQTATEYNPIEGAPHYGFACTVSGYTSQDLALPSMCRLERELTFLAGLCAKTLWDQSVPPKLKPVVDKKGKKDEEAERVANEQAMVEEAFKHKYLRRGLDADAKNTSDAGRAFLEDFVVATADTPAAHFAKFLGAKLATKNDVAMRKAYAAMLLHNNFVAEATQSGTFLKNQAAGAADGAAPQWLADFEKTYIDMSKALGLWVRDVDPEEERRKAEEEAAAKAKEEEAAKAKADEEAAAKAKAEEDAKTAAAAAAAPAGDAPAVPADPAPEPEKADLPPPRPPSPAIAPHVIDKWSCEACTFMNDLDKMKCEICGSAMPGASGAEVELGRPPPFGKWYCASCTFLNDLSLNECEMCQTKKPTQGATPGTAAEAPAAAAAPKEDDEIGDGLPGWFDEDAPQPAVPARKKAAKAETDDDEVARIDAAATLLLDLRPGKDEGNALTRFSRLKSTMSHVSKSLLDPDIMTPRSAHHSRAAFGSDPRAAFPDNESDLRKAFNTFDVDGDGTISPEELRQVVQKLMPDEALTDAQLDELVKKADADGNGRIDFEEFTAAHMQQLLDSNAFKVEPSELPSHRLKTLGDSPDYKWMVEFLTSKSTEPETLRTALQQQATRCALRTTGYTALRTLLETVALASSRCDLVWFLTATMAAAGKHFTVAVEASGAKRIDDLRDAVYALYNTLAVMLKDTLEGARPAEALSMQRAVLHAWNVEWQQDDHMFLQNSGIFTILDAINAAARAKVSRKGKEPAGLLLGIPDDDSKQPVLAPFLLNDVTKDADVKVSSNNEMVASLTDNVSDSFWQSSDGDGTRQITLTLKEPVHVSQVAILVDCSRDDNFRASTFAVTAGPSVDELKTSGNAAIGMNHVGWVPVDVKMDGVGAVRITVGARNMAVRIRQVRVFNGRTEAAPPPAVVASRLPQLALEAMRVFHALANQVFGGMKSDKPAEDGKEDPSRTPSSSLRENVVGLLSPRMDEFARAGLSPLQGGVVQLVVSGFQRLAETRASLPWDKIAAAYGYGDVPKDDPQGTGFFKDDEALFELTQMLLALSVAETGQKCIAESASLLVALFSLVRTGTPRIQRAALDILRKVLPITSPRAVGAGLGTEPTKGPADAVEALLLCIAKSLSVVLRVKGGEKAQKADVRMEQPEGRISQEIATQVSSLIYAVLGSAPGWQDHVRQQLQDAIVGLAALQKLSTDKLLLKRELWLAVAAMAVAGKDKEFLEKVRKAAEQRSADLTARGEVEGKRPCQNCEDGTASNRRCWHCDMDLCAECDRVLHKPGKMREHRRTNVVDETEFRIVSTESSVRADLSALQIALDIDRAKALVGLKQSDATLTSCRCCHATLTEKNTSAIDGVCTEALCQEKARTACTRVHHCGHPCGGIRGEEKCLPCLKGCDPSEPLPQKADDMCMVCFTDELGEAPSVQLACSHIFHYECIRHLLEAKWNGSRITFGFMECPVCKKEVKHVALKDILDPLMALKEAVLSKSLARAKFMGLDKAEEVLTVGGAYHDDLQGFAMHRLCYYQCYKCKQPYFGGEYRCAEQAPAVEAPEELVCDGCSEVVAASICPKHGSDYLEFKCRFCCTPAIWFCFGTTHFCEPCHNDHSRLCGMSADSLNPCPAKGRNEPLGPGTPCPLGIKHPPHGTEFALGCGLCKKEGLKGVSF